MRLESVKDVNNQKIKNLPVNKINTSKISPRFLLLSAVLHVSKGRCCKIYPSVFVANQRLQRI